MKPLHLTCFGSHECSMGRGSHSSTQNETKKKERAVNFEFDM